MVFNGIRDVNGLLISTKYKYTSTWFRWSREEQTKEEEEMAKKIMERTMT